MDLLRWIPLLLLGLLAACGSPGPSPAPTSRLAYVAPDDHVYSVRPDGGDPRRLSVFSGETPLPAGQRVVRWPVWSPDGTRLAFVRLEASRFGDARALVFVVAADGSGLTRVFDSTEHAPIYLSWSPDGAALSLLTQQEQRLHLLLLDPAGQHSPWEVGLGQALYLAWSPDGRQVLVHADADLSTPEDATLVRHHSVGSTEQSVPLAAQPVQFRAPAWSPDGSRLAYVARLPGGQAALTVEPAGGGEPTRLTAVGGQTALLWSPAGDRLAFSTRLTGDLPLYSGIDAIRPDGSSRQRITDDHVLAFYWSPDGRRLAYASMDFRAQALSWIVADADGKNRRQLATFVPSEDQFSMFRFFDQFAQSHGVWSPDGRYLLYAGSPPDGRSPGPLETAPGVPDDASTQPSQVFVVPSDGSAPARPLVDGSLAVWPVPAPPLASP